MKLVESAVLTNELICDLYNNHGIDLRTFLGHDFSKEFQLVEIIEGRKDDTTEVYDNYTTNSC